MKSYKIIIFLLILAIVFAFPFLLTDNLEFNAGNNEKSSGYNYDIGFDNQNLKISQISGKIHINNNWSAAKAAGICTGNGTYSNPYVIENLIIDCGGSGSGIMIENSDAHFKIESCIIYSSGGEWSEAGIVLYNASNGQLRKNNCSSNYKGILLNMGSDNNTVVINKIFNNTWSGIEIVNNCEDNNIKGNTVNESNWIAIKIGMSNNNNISGNLVINNDNGIWVSSSNNTMVSGNSVYNNDYKGIYVADSKYNIISKNFVRNSSNIGIHLDRSDINIVSENYIGFNEGGIILSDTSENLVYRNCFYGNRLNDWDNGTDNQWDNGSIGNYWDNYTGKDINFDGIGDTPYLIHGSAGSQDNYPLMICGVMWRNPSRRIPGYNLFFLLSTLSVVAILIIRKMKKSSK